MHAKMNRVLFALMYVMVSSIGLGGVIAHACRLYNVLYLSYIFSPLYVFLYFEKKMIYRAYVWSQCVFKGRSNNFWKGACTRDMFASGT